MRRCPRAAVGEGTVQAGRRQRLEGQPVEKPGGVATLGRFPDAPSPARKCAVRQPIKSETSVSSVRPPRGLRLARQVAGVILIALACAALVPLGCVPKGNQGGDPASGWSIFDTEDRTLGDVRVWLRQYSDQGVTGVKGSRAADIDMVLINETHSQYEGVESSRLAKAEWILPDVVARKLLNDLSTAGMLQSNSGAIAISQRPDVYVRSMSRKPYSWIAVEHHPPGKPLSYVFLPRHVPRNLQEDEATRPQQKVFLDCLYKVLEAKGNAMYKDASRGTSARDLRPVRPPPPAPGR